MEKELKKKVLVKIEELTSLIKEDQKYQEYLYLEEKMRENKEILDLISSVKAYQKEAVKEEVLGHKDKVSSLDKKIASILEKLETYPLYVDFSRRQKELNELFQMVKYRLEDYLEDKTN